MVKGDRRPGETREDWLWPIYPDPIAYDGDDDGEDDDKDDAYDDDDDDEDGNDPSKSNCPRQPNAPLLLFERKWIRRRCFDSTAATQNS